MSDSYRILLSDKEMPRAWYNILPHLPEPLAPPISPATGQPVTPDELMAIFPESLIQQEMSPEPWIEIPEEVLEIYRLWRPSPLHRARNLEKALGTPARLYYKNEGVSPPGSHKPNTAVPQAYYNKKAGISKLSTETGAGQWGSALSFACNFFDMTCTVYMVKVSYEQKPYRRVLMHTWGGEVYPSPTERTNAGREALKKNPDSLGSLGLAISEAVEAAATSDDTNYALGSVLNHVLLHQTIIGRETRKQLELAEDRADIVLGCVGGGSNFGGMLAPFAKEKMDGKSDVEIIAIEPKSCPTLTKGKYEYDFGDTMGLTPMMLMYTLGHTFEPPGIHAGGLRYHGDAPILCNLVKNGVVDARAYTQNPVFEAAVLFARTEGIIPAPETSHAVRGLVDEALKCKETGEEKAIVCCFSGHGHFDLAAYDAYLEGKLQDYEYPEEKILEALKEVPKVTLPE